ncbi:PrsW family intramembrane metalloprotease [Allonocardiopsis opalescens]|uniref:RsiW-degrading membrane proteinase PrsW (M82 family) n=1 Tax=Allonocardiopsis opalescens TaxID=1144618 RepID=A0A2T0PUF4_9ACTN|nr:PrsW family intramembrane metalloprotease [Allonocardiopsis opalescens]PRX92534.1 RsiW-degrading membrane proteinase PrsW (M82 family) [Allonocardiopsis opalescens]
MPALDAQAILDGRRPGRHSVGLAVTMAFSVVCLLGGLGFDLFNSGTDVVPALLLAFAPVPLLVNGVLWLDRLEPEPARLLWLAFLWGAGVAVALSSVLNTLGLVLYTLPTFGAERGYYISAAVGAPLVEETTKGLVLIGFLWFRRREIDGITDGISYAALVGLGFACVENVQYYVQGYLDAGASRLLEVFFLRGVVTPLLHPLFTSMLGIGVAVAAMSRRRLTRVAAPLAGWLGAVVLHGVWNGSTGFGSTGISIAYGFLLLVLIVLLALMWLDRRRMIGTIARYLPAYTGTGLVTEGDIAMLSTMGGRRRARRWADRAGGRQGRAAMTDYQLAATELALLHWRVEHGIAAPDWPLRRDGLLALMHVARVAFGRGARPSVPPEWIAGSAPPSGFVREEAPTWLPYGGGREG